MSKSNIEWTQDTWNPIVGCSILTPGCTHCYAMKMAARIEAMNAEARERGKKAAAPQYDGTTRLVKGKPVWTGKLALADNVLLQPLKRKKPTMFFVNSMSDLFHEDCPDAWIDLVFAVMALCPQHSFQVLTKRAERMQRWFADVERADHVGLAMLTLVDRIPHGHRRVPWPLPNVWLGVSTERQKEADERIPLLLQTPAAVRFISAEPLLGPIDLRHLTREGINGAFIDSALDGFRSNGYGGSMGPKLDWVIVGGESGPDARPMHPDWARALKVQCEAAGVKFFFKQWGHWSPTHPDWPAAVPHAVANDGTVYLSTDIAFPDGPRYGEAVRKNHDKARLTSMYPIGKAKAGRALDGIEYNEMPEVAR
jgi:protein gp37